MMDCDFLIIGGGIAGLSAGVALSDLGRVVVWEGEDALAYHASGRSAALYEAQYGLPETVALNLASRGQHEAEGVLSPRGLMFVATPEQSEAFAQDLQDLHLAELGENEARAIVPVLRQGAGLRFGYHAEAWDLDTDRMIQSRARQIRGAGGAVETARQVTAVRRSPDGWQVESRVATITAKVLVNAAGAWADPLAELAGIAPLGITPYRRSIARVPAPEGQDVGAWPMIFGTGESWYAKPDAGALIISPAEEDPIAPMDAWAEDEMLATGIARYQEVMDHEVTRLLSNWAGLRSFAPDRRLVLGPDPMDRSFVWCAGQGGYGFQTAPAAGRLVADLVGGRAPELPPQVVAALRPDRLRG